VREFDRIGVEDLNVSGLAQSRKNHHLAKAISDVGWNQFIAITTSKAESAGRRVVKVPTQYTSQDCSG
jgi:putative transposase